MSFAFANATAWGATHYVSMAGSNTYPYDSWATATDSIKLALDAADPWDTVLVAAGAYTADSLPLKKGVVFKGAGMDSTYIHHNGNYAYAVIMSDSCVVEAFHLDGIVDTLGPGGLSYKMARGIFGGSAKFGLIRNNRFTHARYAVYLLFNDNVAVDSNTFSHCYTGVRVWAASTAIRDNTFHRDDVTIGGPIFWDLGIDAVIEGNTFFHEAGKFGQAIYLDQVDHITIRNNTFVAPSQLDDSIYRNRVAICSDCASVGYPTTGVIENNLFVGGERGIGSYGGDVVIRNNIVVGSKARDLVYDTNSTTPGNIRFNLFWENRNVNQPDVDTAERLAAGCLFADPMFRDSLDFHLQAYSPAIDAGDTLLLDPDGTRSDIGPYGGPGGISYTYQDLPPAIPTGFRGLLAPSDTALYLIWRANPETDLDHYELSVELAPCIGAGNCDLFTIPKPDTTYNYTNSIFLGEFFAAFSIRAVDGQGHASGFSNALYYAADNAGPDVRPSDWALHPNSPNPFNGHTRINYSLASPAVVTLSIFDVLGRYVVTLADGIAAAGEHETVWDGKGRSGQEVGSGVYFYRLKAGDFEDTRRMLLLK